MKTLTKNEAFERIDILSLYPTRVTCNGIDEDFICQEGEHVYDLFEDEDEKIESFWCEQLAPGSIDCDEWMQELDADAIATYKQMLADGELYLATLEYEDGEKLEIVLF